MPRLHKPAGIEAAVLARLTIHLEIFQSASAITHDIYWGLSLRYNDIYGYYFFIYLY